MSTVKYYEITDGFYETLMARIKELIPEIKHIDKYKGQYDDPPVDEEGNPAQMPFNVPAAFIQLPPDIKWTSLGQRRKAGEVPFSIHLVKEMIQETSSTTSKAVRELGYSKKLVVAKTKMAIEGFHGQMVTEGFNQFDAIALLGQSNDIEVYNLHADILHFRARLVDDTSKVILKRIDSYSPPVVATDTINTVFDNDLEPDIL